MEPQKPHAVFLPFPAPGHINPLMQLAKLLHFRGFNITFVYTEWYHRRLVQAKGLNYLQDKPGFQFKCLPDNISEDVKVQDIGSLCTLTQNGCTESFKVMLKQLMNESPPASCVVSDGVMTLAMHAANEVGLPEAQFFTASACGFMGYHLFSELVQRGIVPLKDPNYEESGFLETPLEWVQGMKGIRLKDLPSFCHTTDPNDKMLNYSIQQMNNCSKSGAIIINTFYELENDVINALALHYPPIYTIGPLSNLIDKHLGGNSEDMSIFEENKECLTWLDKKAPNSVVYVNFGSIAHMTKDQTHEYAWGLVKCGFDFLWVLRPDVVRGEEIDLGQEFFEEIKERGLVVTWCPQEMVLKHPSLGLFVTHTGWNSLLETIVGGVPILCWPIIAEQLTNCQQVCTVWKNGMEMDKEAKSDKVAELIQEMMVGNSSEEKRKMAVEWKRKAEEATSETGSSSLSLEKLIKHVFLAEK
ncbi:hypothetical protein LUZ60_013760 [Juncus effusus]|nr:hypothetical protein LUZ60_013760 [Juncus effusus]